MDEMCSNLKAFLQSCNFVEEEKIIANFLKEAISYEQLLDLTEPQLKYIVPLTGDQIRFQKSLKRQFKNPPKSSDTSRTPRVLFLRDTSLEQMLNEFVKGRELLKWYQNENPKPKTLETKKAKILVDTIMQWAFLHRKKFAKDEFLYLSKQIVELFECEAGSEDRYFMIKSNKKFGGLLYHRFTNSKRADEFSSERKISKRSKNTVDESTPNKVACLPKNEHISKTWLKSHRDPIAVLVHLESCFNLRETDRVKVKILDDFLNEWPIFKESDGATYITYDFALMYPGKDIDLKKVMMDSAETIIEKAKTMCEQVKRDNSYFLEKEKTEECILKQVLHALAVLMKNGFKAKSKDCIASFLFLKDPEKAPEYPYILEEGGEWKVKIRSLQYKTASFFEALDLLFKLTFVFRVPYPPKCLHIFTFIQRFYFKIETAKDYKSSDLLTLLKELM